MSERARVIARPVRPGSLRSEWGISISDLTTCDAHHPLLPGQTPLGEEIRLPLWRGPHRRIARLYLSVAWNLWKVPLLCWIVDSVSGCAFGALRGSWITCQRWDSSNDDGSEGSCVSRTVLDELYVCCFRNTRKRCVRKIVFWLYK